MDGKPVWADAANGALNGYGSAYTSFRTVGDAEAHTRWRVMSGLLELSSAHAPTTTRLYAIDVSELSVGWGPKRGDGAVRLQFPRVPIAGMGARASNRPVRMWDVKTPGAWVDAADGPRVTADGSSFAHLYCHHADDNLKVDSSSSVYSHVTLLQGDVGAAVELGTYGIGIRERTVRNSSVSGVYVHRITQTSGMDDNLGSLLGSRTCPWNVTLRDLTIRGLFVPDAMGNRLQTVVKLGAYGPPAQRFSSNTSLDRWFFCSNSWWLDDQTIHTTAGETAARFLNLRLLDWKILPPAATQGWLYNFATPATVVVDGLVLDSGRIDSKANLSGIFVL